MQPGPLHVAEHQYRKITYPSDRDEDIGLQERGGGQSLQIHSHVCKGSSSRRNRPHIGQDDLPFPVHRGPVGLINLTPEGDNKLVSDPQPIAVVDGASGHHLRAHAQSPQHAVAKLLQARPGELRGPLQEPIGVIELEP